MGQRGTDWDRVIARAAGGDRAALESLLLRYHDRLRAFIDQDLCRHAPAGVSADVSTDDVLQETLLHAFRKCGGIEPRGGEAFFGWLKAIARTRYVNLLEARGAAKRGGRFKRISRNPAPDATATSVLGAIAATGPTPSRLLERKEALQAVAAAIDSLDHAPRHALELHFGRGESFEAIAKKTGKTVGAVKMLIHRAVARLRRTLEGDAGKVSRDA